MPKRSHQVQKNNVPINQAVRKTLLSRGIHPEELPPAEDMKKVERRIRSDEKASLSNPEALGTTGGDD